MEDKEPSNQNEFQEAIGEITNLHMLKKFIEHNKSQLGFYVKEVYSLGESLETISNLLTRNNKENMNTFDKKSNDEKISDEVKTLPEILGIREKVRHLIRGKTDFKEQTKDWKKQPIEFKIYVSNNLDELLPLLSKILIKEEMNELNNIIKLTKEKFFLTKSEELLKKIKENILIISIQLKLSQRCRDANNEYDFASTLLYCIAMDQLKNIEQIRSAGNYSIYNIITLSTQINEVISLTRRSIE